jgi:shikimate kinase
MKNIVLTGFMGTGKTAVGKELSRLLNMKLVDIDTEIEKNERMTINDIFENFGEKHFREIETEMIKKLSRQSNLIISTGGGAVLREDNMSPLRENGIVFCLSACPETVLKRTSGSDERPLLKVEDPIARIGELLKLRAPFYEKAGIMVDTEGKTPLQIAEEIIETLKCGR